MVISESESCCIIINNPLNDECMKQIGKKVNILFEGNIKRKRDIVSGFVELFYFHLRKREWSMECKHIGICKFSTIFFIFRRYTHTHSSIHFRLNIWIDTKMLKKKCVHWTMDYLRRNKWHSNNEINICNTKPSLF